MPRILEFGYLRFTFPAAGVPPPHRAAGHGVPAPAVPGRAAPLLHPNKHGPQLCNPSSRIKCIFNWIYLWKNFIGWFENFTNSHTTAKLYFSSRISEDTLMKISFYPWKLLWGQMLLLLLLLPTPIMHFNNRQSQVLTRQPESPVGLLKVIKIIVCLRQTLKK